MTGEQLRVCVEGHLLNRMVMHPDGEVRAEAVFYHGQGDYAERYLEVLYPFTEHGIRCTITELPGHGYSPGRRGHCGDTPLLDAVIQDTLSSFAGLPYGVMGHSMGGLLAARHLVLSGRGGLPAPAFAWLSSPLFKPSLNRSALFIRILRLLAPLVPSLTVSTGVKPEMCRIKPEQAVTDPEPGDQQARARHQLWHSRISLGWGAALLDIEKLVYDGLKDIPQDIPLLYTQGGDDPVCRPELAREMYAQFPNRSKRYDEMKGLLHEPFRGDGSESFFAVLGAWLESLSLNPRLCPTRPEA
ncbi:MAG: alpha/beta fold hydrolase [Akkermansiaceae bacterium]|nr:alpha/beta fold hydrolase [Akkermansiaceae bacterium]